MGVGQVGYNNLFKLNKMIKEKTQWVRNDNDMIREIDDAIKNTYYMSQTLVSFNQLFYLDIKCSVNGWLTLESFSSKTQMFL